MNGIPRQTVWLFLLAALSSFGTLGFYYVGEEGILTITSLEMWQRGDWLRLESTTGSRRLVYRLKSAP